MSPIYLGYDPGGGGAHGVAAIDGVDVACDTLATAQNVVDWFRERCQGRDAIVLGVDTLTLWSSGPSGWRPADRSLRAAYPSVSNSVTASNSLYGAMPINGAIVMRLLGEEFESLKITETHPKVLYFALTGNVYNYEQHAAAMVHNLAAWIGLDGINVDSEHAWDALVSAYAAHQWNTREWTHDLHELPQSDNEFLTPVYGNIAHFAWPIPVQPAPNVQARRAGLPNRGNEGDQRGRSGWSIAVERLSRAGHHDIAQQIEQYRNRYNGRAGWDSWFKSNFPALWEIYESGD